MTAKSPKIKLVKTVSAAAKLGKVDVLCASNQCTDASTRVAKMENVEKCSSVRR